MFLFLGRDEHNVWIPAAQLVVERENGEIIAEGLKSSIAFTFTFVAFSFTFVAFSFTFIRPLSEC